MDVSCHASPLDYSTAASFPVLACSNCGYGRTEGASHQAEGLYVGGCYDENEKPWHKLVHPLLAALERSKLRYFACGATAGKKLLDVGCGKGRFLAAAQEHGFKIHGIEPSPRSFAFASARLGNAVAQIGLEDIDKVPGFPDKYDCVMLWHVLEHLDNPAEVLAQLKGKLADEGRLVIGVPNFASYQARFGKADWYHLDPPRHAHHFSPESLRILSAQSGYAIERIFFNSFYQDLVGEIITAVNKMLPGKNVVFNGLRLNRAYLARFGRWRAWSMFALGAVASLLIAFPALFFTVFNQFAGRSGTMVVVMKQNGGA
jgi:2-polyprenyl-3-methyl-5-hydroxy-6-metoxy-1,4-benzoquinol methylase